MKQSMIVLAAVVVIAAAWFFVSPLFIDESVDEGFDFTRADGSFDLERVMSMPAEKRLTMMPDVMNAAANAPDQPVTEAMTDSAPTVIARGDFVDADAIHKGSGQATLYALANGSHVIRLEDFRTTNGPALVVYLAAHAEPQSAADVSENGFLNLGKLKGNVGNQNYPIPIGTDVEKYNSVAIWCELFGVLFSPAALNPVE